MEAENLAPPGSAASARAAVAQPVHEQVEQPAGLSATSLLLDGVGGRYFEDCNEAEPHRPGTRRGVADYALDPEAATLLWPVSVDTLSS